MTDAPAPPPALRRNRPGEGGRPPDTAVRSLRKALRGWVTRPLARLGLAILPWIYLAYARLVFRTSRVDDVILLRMDEVRNAHDGVVVLVWHEDSFFLPFAYGPLHPHTLTATGDAGEAAARLSQRCGYVVFRGGSGRGAGSRRRVDVLPEMIAHMKANPKVMLGFTVDGSRGPPYRLKRGGLVVAMECRKPIIVVKSWARRHIRLPTWDRTAIPLPFNDIRLAMRGPFFVPEEARTSPGAFEALRRKLERELCELTEEVYRGLGHSIPEGLYAEAAP